MSRKILIIAAGALVAVGSAAAVAQLGDRDGRGRDGGHRMGGWSHHHADDGERGHHRGWRGRRGHRGEGRRRRDFTKAEFDTRVRERFARFDANNDGVIDVEEVRSRFSERAGRRGARGGRFMQRMQRRFDTNRDNKITKAEFDAVLKERFARLDLNNDGRISDDDLPPMLRGRNILSDTGQADHRQFRRGSGKRRGRGMRMLRQLRGADTNKDGFVSFEEFGARSTNRFQRFDRNKDNVLDQSDSDTLRKEIEDYRVKRFIHRFGPEADKSGKVTRDQFSAKATERFARMDRNNDGRVDRSDRGQEGRGWRRGRGGHRFDGERERN